jgi:hypothetical protein
MQNYWIFVRKEPGVTFKATTTAESQWHAQQFFESMYGDNIIGYASVLMG